MQRGGDVAADGDIGVGGQRDGGREHILTDATERLEREAAVGRVGILQKFLGAGDALVAEVRQQPDGARGDVGVRVLGELERGGQRLRAEALRGVEAEVADVHGRVAQRGDGAGGRGQVELRDDGFETLRGDAVDRAGAGVVERLVAAHAGVVPVGHVDRAIGADGDVGRAEPDVLAALARGLDTVEVRALEFAGRVRGDEILAGRLAQREGALPRLELVGEDGVAGRLAVEERAVPGVAERAVLVDGDAGRGTRAVDVADIHGVGVVLAPVGARRRLARTTDGAIAGGLRRGVARGAVLQDEGRAAAARVVVVALEEVAEGGREVLVAVAVAVADDLGAGAVGVHAGGETGGPDEAVVALGAGGGLRVVGPGAAALVDVARGDAEGLARLVGEGSAAVAGVQVKLAVGARDDRVERVVMVLAAEAAEEHLALVDHGVELAVAVDVGELDEVGRVRDDDDVVEDGDAERRSPTGVLDERGDGVGLARALGVAQDDDAVAFGPALAALVVDAVVDALGDPDATLRVDVEVGRVGQHRGARPEGDLQALGDLEAAERDRAAFGRLVGFRGGREDGGGQQERDEAGHGAITACPRESSSLSLRAGLNSTNRAGSPGPPGWRRRLASGKRRPWARLQAGIRHAGRPAR